MARPRRTPPAEPATTTEAKAKGGPPADYITVADRIGAFYEAHPTGMIVCYADPRIAEIEGKSYWIYGAKAVPDFRTPERYGVGYAQEIIPGLTPFTRGSELQNAETAAWGRAIAALGFRVHGEIATLEEQRPRRHEQEAGVGLKDDEILPLAEDRETFRALVAELSELRGEDVLAEVEAWVVANSTGGKEIDALTRKGYLYLIDQVRRWVAVEQERIAAASPANETGETEAEAAE